MFNKFGGKTKIYIGRLHPFSDGLDVYIRQFEGDEMYDAKPLVFEKTEDRFGGDSCMTLSPEDGQEIMDCLWRCGLRPIEGSGSAGSLAATERHLSDMKTIAWHALKIGGSKK